MRRHLCDLLAKLTCIVALMLATWSSLEAYAANAAESRKLQLEVFINGEPTKLIGSFAEMPDGRMAARRAELTEIGIKPPASGSGDEVIIIDELSGVTYRRDEVGQKIYFTLGDAQRIPKILDLRGGIDDTIATRSDVGAVLNYQLSASSTKSVADTAFAFSGANATLDARVFGPAGSLSQSAILGATSTRRADALRLETTWVYSNSETMQTYRAGDLISGGLLWTRPIRLAGVQLQRDFALRPDLVTLPLPTASGSAAVPSTLDIYVNNFKTFSQDIPSGPFQITNIPTLSAAGSAQIVVRDAAGHQTQTSIPFFTSPKLLREGLYDFSLEAGVPRLRYGVDSNAYLAATVGSASLRGGLHDWLTIEAHVEGNANLLNAGLGLVTGLGSWGVASFATSGSRFGQSTGFQTYAAFDTQIMKLNFHASSQRTFGSYNDLASITANPLQNFAAYLNALSVVPYALVTSARPPKSLDAITVGLQLPFFGTSLSAGYARLVPYFGSPSNLLTLAYSCSLFIKATANVTAFSDLSNRKNAGVFFGLSMPLDAPLSSPAPTLVSTNATRSRAGSSIAVEAMKSMQLEPGSYGWWIRDSEIIQPDRSAAASYRSSFGQIDGRIQQVGKNGNGSLQAQGAIAAMGGGVFLSNRIDDAFAVVDAGASGVEVFYENRPTGKTDEQGLILIPTLRSYQKNKLAIEPRNLPLNADAPLTKNIVAPANRGGVVVRFGVKADSKAAIVILTRKDGRVVEVGANGRLESTNDAFVVGYDGRAYVKGLGPFNSVIVSDGGSDCRASFDYSGQKDKQVVIGPIVCQ